MKNLKEKIRRLKESKGITLIALVITIIVLIILASISIAMLIGDNGLITKAMKAKEETEIKAYHEKIELIRTELRLKKENYEPPTLEELQNEFDTNQKDWVANTDIRPIDGIEKLELITKEEYIFHITKDRNKICRKRRNGRHLRLRKQGSLTTKNTKRR